MRIKLACMPLLVSVLLGCGANETLTPDPTFQGKLTLARLQAVQIAMEDGSAVPLDDVLVGFRPSSRLIVGGFPGGRYRWDIGLVPTRRYQLLFRGYDSNRNDILDQPEMAVMYVQEASLGLGHPVTHLSYMNVRIEALQLATADIGGLMEFIQANSRNFDPETRQLFRDMTWIAERIRSAQRRWR
jgi:hypothetical protein